MSVMRKVLLAMSTTTALAGQGYGAVAGESTGGGGGGGTLPFTGADIALYAVIGGVVAASCFALRRYGARRGALGGK